MRGAMYRSQTKSKLDRVVPHGFAADDFIPYKRYGKTHYRGKITPYGKRIKRYEDIVDLAWVYVERKFVRMISR